jgi:hypothetical protein
MRRRDFCGMTVMAGAAALLPVGQPGSAVAESSQDADLRAVKLSGAETTIERAAVRDLRGSLSGTLLIPGEADYETARHVWNGMIDKHPALIARCADTADVDAREAHRPAEQARASPRRLRVAVARRSSSLC